MVPNWLKASLLLIALVATGLAASPMLGARYDRRVVDDLHELRGQYMNREVPDFQLYDIEGHPFRLSDHRGKVIFLNLWASWCPPCREELPSMARLSQLLRSSSDRFVMIAVAWDEDPEELQRFLGTVPGLDETMVLALDPGGELTKQLGTRLVPETYIIDRGGRIVARFQDLRAWDEQAAVRLCTTLMETDP